MNVEKAMEKAKDIAKAGVKARVITPLVPVQPRMVVVSCMDQRSIGLKIAPKLTKGRAAHLQLVAKRKSRVQLLPLVAWRRW